jgi:photosystem II stability/assembly factor-like uncharacterized protein
MKLLLSIVTFYILLLNAQNANCDWRLVYEAKNWKYYRISSFDSNSVAVLGGVNMYEDLRPKLFVSTNSGDNWKQIITDSVIYQVPSDRIGFIKPNNLQYFGDHFIYLACDSGRIIKIDEDGSKWEWISYNINGNLKYLKIIDDGGCYLVSDKYLYWSSGSDTNAVQIPLPDFLNLCLIKYFNAFSKDSLLLVLQHPATNDYFLIKSTNAGMEWHSRKLFNTNSSVPFFFTDLDFGWCTISLKDYINAEIFSLDFIFSTQDGGYNWIHYRDTVNLPGRGLYSLNFLDRYLGMASGSKGRMLITKDGGSSWEAISVTDISDTSYNYSISYPLSDNKYLAFCSNGKVYKYDTLQVGINEHLPLYSETVISPNPASDYIDINLERWSPSHRWTPSEIRIYNSLGQCVLSPAGGGVCIADGGGNPLSFGEGPGVRLNISAFSPGLYFISINNGKDMLTGSFIVMR